MLHAKAGDDVKIENLKYFLTVARMGSIHKAADALFLSPQNLGTIMKNVEKETETALFVRTPRGVQLTPDGERFLSHAKVIVDSYEDFFAAKKKSSNILNLYTTPSQANELDTLQGKLLQGQYYLSVRKKSVDDLFELLDRNVPGIYLLALSEKDKIHFKNYQRQYKLFQDSTALLICHSSNSLLHTTNQELSDALKDRLVIMQEPYEDIYGTTNLHIDNMSVCKKMMREREAVYLCLSSFFYKKFPEKNEWVILREHTVPQFEFVLLFNIDCDEDTETIILEEVTEIFSIVN